MILRLRPASLWLVSVLLALATIEDVGAQPGAPQMSVFPPAPRSLRQNLVRAQKAIDEGRFSDAVAEIGVVLTGKNADLPNTDESQDFFIESAGHPGTQTSVKAEAQRLLGTLPPQGRELFELQFGADARALFAEAVRTSDVNRLNEVVRQYFHTSAGYEAAMLLGRLHLDHGRPLAAALCLQRVAQVPGSAARFEPELSLLLAACWQLAGQPDRAQAAIAALPRRVPPGPIRLGDRELADLPSASNAVDWLTQNFRGVSLDEVHAEDWPLYRGNPSRNASRTGGLPLRRSRWQAPLVSDEHDGALIEELRTGFLEQGTPMLPVVQPLAVGNVVVLRSAERVVGIDFESGKRIWTYPFWDIAEDDEGPASMAGLPPRNEREQRLGQLRDRLWQDVPYGQVSSDGHSIFLLDGARQTPTEMNPRLRWNRPRGFGFPMEALQLQNELVALDLEREGYILWKVGGENGGDEPELAGVFFLGPPLPLFGHLYLVAEIKGELRLVVLDAKTGEQQWSQQLAHMEAMFGIDEHARRYSGATPSFADGVLVCPTSAGAVVAVDVATRTLLWGYQYSSLDREPFGRAGLMQPLSLQGSLPLNRWRDASVTIADGVVLLTPAESDQLICLDLLTGRPRWKPLPRSGELADMLYVAGIHDGAAILVGRNRVTAIRLKDGTPAWKEAIKLDVSVNEMPSGRGFLSSGYYYLPTTNSQLAKIDLAEGKIVERTGTDHPLGNVICFRDEILSVGPDRAAAFFQIEPLRVRVAERLQKSPQDAWALARQGELLIHDGQVAAALDVLRRAHRANARDEGVRALLVDTFLNALSQDFTAHIGLAPELAPLIDSDARRGRYLMLVATGHQRAGALVPAAEHLAELTRVVLDSARKVAAGSPFETLTPAKDWSVRSDRFLAARLAELHQSSDSRARETIEELIGQLASSTQSGTIAEMRRVLLVAGFHPGTDALRLQFAEKLVEARELLEAEQTLIPLVERHDPGVTAPAVLLLARLYDLANKPQLAAAAYQRLQVEWGDRPIEKDQTGQQVATADPDKSGWRSWSRIAWPWGKTTVNETHEAARLSPYAAPQPGFPIVQRRGTALEDVSLVFEVGRPSTYLRDAHGAATLRLPPMESRPRSETGLWQTAADSHLLMTCFAGTLTAANTLNPRPNESDVILWREAVLAGEPETIKVITREYRNPFDSLPLQTSRFGDQLNRPLGAIGPLTAHGAVFQKVRSITCLDAHTGLPVWARNDFEQGCELHGDREVVLVVPAQAPAGSNVLEPIEATLLSVTDGRTLGTRTIPRLEQRWFFRGRNLLAWESVANQPNTLRLYLRDVVANKDIWSQTFATGSRGCLINHDQVAVLDNDGQLVIRSLSDDSPPVKAQLEPLSSIHSIRILASAEQLWVVVNDGEPAAETESWRRKQFIPADGRVYSLDRSTGRRLWQAPALVRGFGLLVDQPSELPTLWFVRYRASSSPQFGAGNARIDVLCLDRRTGAAIFAKSDIPSTLTHTEVMADPRKKEVTLALPQAQFTVRFTDEPRPPAPAFQQFRDGNRVDAAFEKLGDLMESVKDVFVPGSNNDPFK